MNLASQVVQKLLTLMLIGLISPGKRPRKMAAHQLKNISLN
ncbi:unnamed protein product [Gongylonema pulchrum]|uniref:Uncharacterized protein n=1 Tax=Gongylonema pulchrum TaxID=637853 RepID=A0A183DEA2_9BILA|nr:unnamed protein product [Gongylonema pulchrum]